VQSAEANRSYITLNLKLLKTVYGEAAVKKTIIFITKGEINIDTTKKWQEKKELYTNNMNGYIKEAR